MLASTEIPTATSPSLGQIIGRIAHVLAAEEFPTGDRARLKRLHPDKPPDLTFYRFAFRYLPEGWERRQAAWMTIIAGMAIMGKTAHRPKRPVGLALAESKYSEFRLERLLATEGKTLQTLLLRAVRLLAAKNEPCNWTDFAYLLGLRGDPERARLQIARAYYNPPQNFEINQE